jgi:hypothetical protein
MNTDAHKKASIITVHCDHSTGICGAIRYTSTIRHTSSKIIYAMRDSGIDEPSQ